MEAQRTTQFIASTPTKPGVYIMKDAKARVLYVGKATNLRSRLRSYFTNSSEVSLKIRELMPRVSDFEYIVTDSESEALLLENTLIKRHQPRFNIHLKDDKTYPYLRIDVGEDWPRLEITRRANDDGARYFGPFASASSMRKMMALLKRLFPYRSCTKEITGNDARPCLEYYINRCVAPCVGKVDRGHYHQIINQVILFLEGNHDKVLKALRSDMEVASEELNYERAGSIRDQIRAIQRVNQEQKVVSTTRGDQDIIALAQVEDEAWVEIFFVRKGKLTGRDHFIMRGARDEDPPTVLGAFVKQFYISTSFIPPKILVQFELPEMEALKPLVEQRRGKRVVIHTPARGESRKLVALVARNAQEGLEQRHTRWLADQDKVSTALGELQECLSLERPPRRIETYDISNIQGTNAVGSMVVFEDGRPKPSSYRKFKIKAVTGIDDYSMIREVLSRRFHKLTGATKNGHPHFKEGLKKTSGGEWTTIPDLVLIDGGKGHLSAALETLLHLGLASVPLASVAKREEQIFSPDMVDPVALPRNSQGLYLIQRMRDEAHRFAINYHRDVRSKRSVGSAIDDISGIGPKRKRSLIRQFGSAQAIREAPIEAITAVDGITQKLAERIKASL